MRQEKLELIANSEGRRASNIVGSPHRFSISVPEQFASLPLNRRSQTQEIKLGQVDFFVYDLFDPVNSQSGFALTSADIKAGISRKNPLIICGKLGNT